MIAESAGATPFGIFCLADEFLESAKSCAENARGARTYGPTRLLAYHACELYLKTYLRSHGETINNLRNYGHDLSAMLDACQKHHLSPNKTVINHIGVAARRNDYVRVRYLVVDGKYALRLENVIKLAKSIRECVRLALKFDQFGNPTKNQWHAREPKDYIKRHWTN